MKRLIALLLTLVMVLALVACNTETQKPAEETEKPAEATEQPAKPDEQPQEATPEPEKVVSPEDIKEQS